MKKFTKLLGIVLIMALVMSMGITAAFAGDPVTPAEPATPAATPTMHTVSTTSTTHTYEIYQIFTGEKSGDQLINLKYGQNAKTGTPGASVSATDMKALDTIAHKTYANDQEKINDLSAYVNLSNPIATIGKGGNSSVDLAEGYYVIKDKDNSLQDPETYTLYLFNVLGADQEITPKTGTTTVDKDVTETNDSTGTVTPKLEGADYDQGDSIPYSIDITLAENVTDYKTYTVTLTDTLSTGLTPPAQSAVTVTFKDKSGTAIPAALGTPTVTVDGQVITVTYTIKGSATDDKVAVGAIEGASALNGAIINVSYEAVLNANAVTGVAGNPNTYTITYTNNPNGNDTGETPKRDVKVYTYELEIEKKDGNGQPLQGAGFTLYKEVAGTTTPAAEEGGEPTTTYPESAKTGAELKAALPEGSKVDMSKLDDAKHYVAVSMTETVASGKVTHKTDTKIDAGNYVLVETTVPAGYNAYAGENITITSTIDAEGNLTSLSATPATLSVESKALVKGEVENNSGTTLPSTGGIGTTIFYVVGSIMVVAAGVLLITKKRMSREG